MREIAYLGTKGHVVAVDVETGKELWRTYVRTSTITNVAVSGDVVLVYAKGHLFGLRKGSGKVMWENKLDGLGYGCGILGVEGGQNAALASAVQQQAAAAAATAAAGAAAASASSG